LLSRTPIGRFLVLHTTGRRSGRPRKTPLSYTKDGDTYVVIASNGGSPGDADWYLDLQGAPDAEVEVSGRRSRVRARHWRGAGAAGGAEPSGPAAAMPAPATHGPADPGRAARTDPIHLTELRRLRSDGSGGRVAKPDLMW
jgi:deazaflavin-dependent oxidoreductase (nitroreductase family)